VISILFLIGFITAIYLTFTESQDEVKAEAKDKKPYRRPRNRGGRGRRPAAKSVEGAADKSTKPVAEEAKPVTDKTKPLEKGLIDRIKSAIKGE